MTGVSTARAPACRKGSALPRRLPLWLFVACLLPGFGSLASAKPSLPEPRINVTLDQKNNAAEIRASILIPATPRIVWRVMVDCGRAFRIIAGLVTCRVLESSSDGTSDLREHVIDKGFPLPRLRNVFRSHYELYRFIRFARTDGDLRVSDGLWRLEPKDSGNTTLVSYHARIALKTPLPGIIVRAGIRTDFPEVLRALRREALKENGQDD